MGHLVLLDSGDVARYCHFWLDYIMFSGRQTPEYNEPEPGEPKPREPKPWVQVPESPGTRNFAHSRMMPSMTEPRRTTPHHDES